MRSKLAATSLVAFMIGSGLAGCGDASTSQQTAVTPAQVTFHVLGLKKTASGAT